ncbi:MAG: hypothetical protein LBD40_01410 [Puniceicoccales bacterium]|jgi:hypothetical protein|nr:hypothetical protein [Puniceicoccales bacterium]
MNKKLINIAVGTLCIGSSLMAKEPRDSFALPPLSLKTDIRFDSEYVYRGAKLGQQVFIPKVELGASLFEKGRFYFGNENFLLVKNSLSNRNDLCVGFSYDLTDLFTVDGALTFHLRKSENITLNQQGGKKDTKEIYVGLLSNVCWNPSLYYSYDITWKRHNLEGRLEYPYDLTPLGVEGFAVALRAKAGFDRTNKPLGIKNSFEPGGRHHGKKKSYAYYGAGIDLVRSFNENCEGRIGVNYEGTSTKSAWIHGPSAWLFTVRKNLAWFSTSLKWDF